MKQTAAISVRFALTSTIYLVGGSGRGEADGAALIETNGGDFRLLRPYVDHLFSAQVR